MVGTVLYMRISTITSQIKEEYLQYLKLVFWLGNKLGHVSLLSEEWLAPFAEKSRGFRIDTQ